MVLKPNSDRDLGAPQAPEEQSEDISQPGARPRPRTPVINCESDGEDSIAVLDLVEEEATPADQPGPEHKIYEKTTRVQNLHAIRSGHVEKASRVFNKIKARTTVQKNNLLVLPEGVNRTLHRVATSRIEKKPAPAPLLTCYVCQVTLTGKHQLHQHRGGKKHRAREARHKREAEDFYYDISGRFFPSAHDLDNHPIGSIHRCRAQFLRERELSR